MEGKLMTKFWRELIDFLEKVLSLSKVRYDHFSFSILDRKRSFFFILRKNVMNTIGRLFQRSQSVEPSQIANDQPSTSTSTSTILSAHFCIVCHRSTYKRCKACHEVYYCDRPCQERDWPFHRCFCRLEYPPKKNPTTNADGIAVASVRAVLLPDDDPKPRFIELSFKSGERSTFPDVSAYLADGFTGGSLLIYEIADGSKQRSITAIHNQDRGRINECVMAMSKNESWWWYGPIILCANEESAPHPLLNTNPRFVDIRKEVCGHIVEYFVNERKNKDELKKAEKKEQQAKDKKQRRRWKTK